MASPVVALNDQEFVLLLKSTDLMKYSTVNKEWTLFLKCNENVYDSMMMDQQLNRLYLCNARGNMTVKDLSTGSTLQKASNAKNATFSFVNANGTIHGIGVFDFRQVAHVTWNNTRGFWNPFRSEVVPRRPRSSGGYLIILSLIYVKSKNIILMLGGITDGPYDNDPNEIALWRFDIATSTWKYVKIVVKDWCETRAVLTSDDQNLIIVGRGWIKIMNIQDDNDYKVTKSIVLPNEFQNGSPYPVLMKCQETDVIALTSAWFRKVFSSKQHGQATCPLDIL